MYTRRAAAAAAATPMFAPHHAPPAPDPRAPAAAPEPPAPPTAAPRVTVVIPARNEARNLPGVLAELPAGLHEVILVDGASEDGTIAAARLARPDIRVLRQTGRGKGNALACGILAATGDIAVTLDADGSADPAEIAEFVSVLRAGADFAKGSRYLPGGGSSDLTAVRRIGNGALVFLMNRLYRTAFSDLCYGYNAFWTRCTDVLHLEAIADVEPCFGDGFEIETLLAAHAANARLTVAEVPSYERDRRYGVSQLRTWRDGRRVLRAIVRERLRAPARGETRPASRSAAAPRTVAKP
jgi:glycosyltransferase involved in cell wall biosynthesis